MHLSQFHHILLLLYISLFILSLSICCIQVGHLELCEIVCVFVLLIQIS